MKKLIAIPLLLLYLVAVSGTMVQLHFCGSKLASVTVNESEKASCCCSPQKSAAKAHKAMLATGKDDCCQDKTITLKIGQDQNTVQGIFLQLSSFQLALLPQPPAPVMATLPQAVPVMAYRANAPPGRWQDIPLYKLHSRFTYYG
ncbi:HYC_CC_PP family protein [Taibaiella koreensis]|uniref:HYC_CC_PP family protein n=1 Tax=Taibaiella koreensis TaxID=1268548 RepID=UPI000E59E0C4|nr:hypothetical protein [Taibaiella koreensis]